MSEADSVEKSPPAGEARAVSAGRGLLYITGAKLWFMVGGYAIVFALPHLLDQALVGQYNLILSFVSVLNNVIVTSTIQGVSKFGAEGNPAQRAALKLQLVLGSVLALGFVAGAPLIGQGLKNPELVGGLRIVSIVVLCYSLYAVFVGAANGARAFHKQAGLDATYTTLRASLVLGGALVTHAVFGAVWGFALAAIAILAVSIRVVGVGPREPDGRLGQLVRFLAPVAGYLAIMNVLMFVDLWLLTRLETDFAERTGIVDAAKFAAEQAAIYANGVQAFARIPYQLILSVTIVIFPFISKLTFTDDKAATRDYVRTSMRYSLLGVAAMATGISARPGALLALFGAKYVPGGPALPPLAFGYVAFSLLSIAGSIINGAGRTLPTIVIGAVTLAVDVGANFAAVSWATAHGHDPLVAAATATALAMALGLLLALGYLQRTFGASLPLSSVARAALATAAGIAAGRLLPVHGKLGLAAVLAGGAVFVVALVATRELTAAEVKALRKRR